MTTTVGGIMRRDVAPLRGHDSILKAWRLMLEHDLSELPVVDNDGRLLGIFSDSPRTPTPIAGRALRWWHVVFGEVERFARDYRYAFGKTVGELMIPAAICIDTDAQVETAAALLRAHGGGVLPVVSAGVVVGFVTRTEVIRAIPA